MTESDTDFLSRMFSQSAVPQGQAADPDMTRLLKMATEAVRLREALEAAETMLMVLPNTNTNARGTRPTMTTVGALNLVRAALKKEST